MNGLLALLTRRPDLGRAAAQDHWRNRHAQYVTAIPGIDRYLQHHADGHQPELGFRPCPLDGIAEVWLAAGTAARDIASDVAYTSGAMLDEPNFLDTNALEAFAVRSTAAGRPPPFPALSRTVILLDPGSESDLDARAATTAVTASGLPSVVGVRSLVARPLDPNRTANLVMFVAFEPDAELEVVFRTDAACKLVDVLSARCTALASTSHHLI